MGGIYSNCFRKRDFRVILTGLDAAGKTTILYRLKLGEVVTTIPTIGFNVETIDFRGIRLTAWDLGGRDKARALHRHYYPNTDVLIYMIDSGDRERIGEVKDEISRYATEDELRHVPFAIVCNKQDLDGAMTIEEICEKLSLVSILPKNKLWEKFGVVATTGEGLDDVLQWLYDVTTSMDKESIAQGQKLEPKKGWLSLPKYLEKFKNMFFEI